MSFRGRKDPVSGLPICSHLSPVSESNQRLARRVEIEFLGSMCRAGYIKGLSGGSLTRRSYCINSGLFVTGGAR